PHPRSTLFPYTTLFRSETENLEQVKEALAANADIIMLDNMSIDTMKKAVDIISNKCATEASGNISLDNIRSVANTGVDFISLGIDRKSTRLNSSHVKIS